MFRLCFPFFLNGDAVCFYFQGRYLKGNGVRGRGINTMGYTVSGWEMQLCLAYGGIH